MTLTLRPPIEIENLLPCDINYKLHDKNTGTSSTEWLMKGGATPIHTVELSHLLLISLTPIDTGE
jgi:vacuolar protein sorting-associated protein 13A/C